MDFYQICTREIEKGPRKGLMELYPDFKVGRSKDLMVRGHSFYAIWDEEAGLWSTDEYDVQRLVDQDLYAFAEKERNTSGMMYVVRDLHSSSNNVWYQFKKYVQHLSDNSHNLDSNLTFANTDVKKTDYVSRRLPYSLEEGDCSSWDEVVGTLYSVDERAKIEWLIGCIVSGDSKKVHKFGVFYGAPGTGKGTILNVVLKLFDGYTTTFDAKALGSSNAAFATEVFRNNPLVAVQQDGDLSRIEDNAKLNSIISHEPMPMNEKYKPVYTDKVNALLLLGTNKPVKISDAKSGIIRRLIDIHPTGVVIPENHYNTLMSRIDFELGAIAHHCLNVYREMGRNYYTGYRPTEMMLQTDIFFNYIEAYYDIFKGQDATTLKQAYSLYKEYCKETTIEHVMPQYRFRTELRNYFDEFRERGIVDGVSVRSVYSGFNANKFKAPISEDNVSVYSLVLEETESLLDELLADEPAQGATQAETPLMPWAKCTTKLTDIDTSNLHFVKVPKNHIVIDFDLKDENGKKSLERNLEAASVWPSTYAELSKSGSGVHLHYIYEGDVEELSNTYSEGIEVKALLGNSSLRRRLSKCNNIPVAIYSGPKLPQKEKKVLSSQIIKSERGLRELIERNLRKEIHSGTKSSVDFIKKILDEQYEAGMVYDVSDMRGRIMAFANNSSNQPLQALKTVKDMKFVGADNPGANQDPTYDVRDISKAGKDDRIVFFDVEIYPNLFVVVWKYQGDANPVKLINPTAAEIELLFQFKLVGYNNRRYDNHILWACFMGYNNLSLYNLSKAIIDRKRNAMFGEAYNLSYADIYEFASIKQSLKKWQIELGLPHKELDLPWDQPVDKSMWDRVVSYCINDVMSTEAVFENRKQDYIARLILADLSGLAVNDTTQRHTQQIIFGNDRQPQEQFNNPDLSKEFPGYVFDAGKSSYRGENPSEGGYNHAEPGMYENVAVLDVASMHPTSIKQLNLFGEYTPNFTALIDARIAIKHKDYYSAKKMLNGMLARHLDNPADADALAYALKIVINIVYGMTSASFENVFRSHKNIDNKVAKRGALFMIDLKHFVQERGFTVAHIKTDSIKIPNATDEIIEEVTRFGEKYGYTFEHEVTYDKFCLIDKAQYIAKKRSERDPKAWEWDAVGAQFQHPYVYKTLFTGEPIEFNDLCETKQVSKGAIYMDYSPDRPMATVEACHFVGRVGRFIPIKEGFNGGILYRVVEDKFYAVTGTKGYLWIEAELGESLENIMDAVDMSYFEKLARESIKDISQYGDFDEFVRVA